MKIILWVFLCACVYTLISLFKKGFMKRSLLIKDKDSSIKNIYLKAFVEAIISTLGLLIAVFIIYSFMKTPLPNLLAFGFGAFAAFYLSKLILFRILQKSKTK